MAGPLLFDNVLESSTTTGTGTYTLAGAVSSFQSFAPVGDGNTCPYAAWEVDGNGNRAGGWEVGIGTYTASGTTLARTTVTASSNAGAAVNWSAGTRYIGIVLPAAAISTFALTLLNDADAATMRATLGLGSLATQNGTFSGTSSGTNTGDQTSIAGITGSLAEFNAALTGADFATGGGTVTGASSGTNTGDQTSVSGNAGTATALQNARTIDGQSFNGTANITVIAPGTTAATSKATPVDADQIPLVDSAASNVLKKLTWANLKAILRIGTTTNDNAAAGDVGEYVESPVPSGSSVSLTSATPTNVTSISLTAGDWDVDGFAGFIATNATTTQTQFSCSISLTSATTDLAYFAKSLHTAVTPGNGVTSDVKTLAIRRVSIAATTTVYLICSATFAVSTGGAFGRLAARRVR